MSIIFKVIFGFISTWTRTLTYWFLQCASVIKLLPHWILVSYFNFIMLWFVSTWARRNRSIFFLFVINYSHWILGSFNSSLFNIICPRTKLFGWLGSWKIWSFAWTEPPIRRASQQRFFVLFVLAWSWNKFWERTYSHSRSFFFANTKCLRWHW